MKYKHSKIFRTKYISLQIVLQKKQAIIYYYVSKHVLNCLLSTYFWFLILSYCHYYEILMTLIKEKYFRSIKFNPIFNVYDAIKVYKFTLNFVRRPWWVDSKFVFKRISLVAYLLIDKKFCFLQKQFLFLCATILWY